MCNEYSKKMTAIEIKEYAQILEDKKNWGFPSLTSHERLMMVCYNISYLELTGKPLKLEYNCPS